MQDYVVQDYVIRDYVTFGVMSFGILSRWGFCGIRHSVIRDCVLCVYVARNYVVRYTVGVCSQSSES